MTTDVFNFANIAGQFAVLEINNRDSHISIYWGKLCISDTSGEIGFWITWHKTGMPWLKGAALAAALHKYAKSRIEQAIYEHIEHMQEQLKNAE